MGNDIKNLSPGSLIELSSDRFEAGFNIYNSKYYVDPYLGINKSQNQAYLASLMYSLANTSSGQFNGSYTAPIYSDFKLNANTELMGSVVATDLAQLMLSDMQLEVNEKYSLLLYNKKSNDFSEKINAVLDRLVNAAYVPKLNSQFDNYLTSLNNNYNPDDILLLFKQFEANNGSTIQNSLRLAYRNQALNQAESGIVSDLNVEILKDTKKTLSDRLLLMNGMYSAFTGLYMLYGQRLVDQMDLDDEIKEMYKDE